MNPKAATAIVTGGGSGLGAETARRLAKAGSQVAVVDRNADAAATIASEIGGHAYPCDVSSEEGARETVARIAREVGNIRILVNCAGIGTAKRIVGRDGPMPLDDFSRVITVNLIGSFNMMRLAAAEMAKLEPLEDGERGVIISTASVAAYDGQLGQAAYAASKGGIVSLTLPAAREFAQFGIRVLALAPGLFLTPLLAELPEPVQQSLGDSIPFPWRLGDPGEFADLVGHCVTNRALNGEVIRIDGALRLPPR